MTQKINLVTLGVDDLNESILFYEDALGCTSMAQEGNVAIFSLSNAWLALLTKGALTEESGGLFQSDDDRMDALSFLSHHVANKASVDQMIDQAVEAGAKLFKQPCDLPAGEYVGYFTDPDGHLWRVIWNPHFCTTYPDFQLGGYSLPN